MTFMGFPILPSWFNSYAYFAPGLNFNLFCLKLNYAKKLAQINYDEML